MDQLENLKEKSFERASSLTVLLLIPFSIFIMS